MMWSSIPCPLEPPVSLLHNVPSWRYLPPIYYFYKQTKVCVAHSYPVQMYNLTDRLGAFVHCTYMRQDIRTFLTTESLPVHEVCISFVSFGPLPISIADYDIFLLCRLLQCIFFLLCTILVSITLSNFNFSIAIYIFYYIFYFRYIRC